VSHVNERSESKARRRCLKDSIPVENRGRSREWQPAITPLVESELVLAGATTHRSAEMRPTFEPAKQMCLAGWGEVEGWLPDGLTFAGVEHSIDALDGQPDDLSGSFIMSFIRDGEKDVPGLYRSYFQQLREALGQLPNAHLDSGCPETKEFGRRATWLSDAADLQLTVAASWEICYYEYVDFSLLLLSE